MFIRKLEVSGLALKAYLVPERKLPISPISVSDLSSNPRNPDCIGIPVVRILIFLELENIF
jgi:hypothetical protein